MISRPVLRWHGGKFMLAEWIASHFPPHRVYVEPFGGAASVLLRKPRSYAEVYNDLDGGVVELFRVLRDPDLGAKLVAALRLTPFSRDEFNQAYEPSPDPVERSRRLIIRAFQGFGSNGHNASTRTGFRAKSNRSGTAPAGDWVNYPTALVAVIERVRGVVIENRPAIEVMAQHDGDDVLHYVDPPYLPETRDAGGDYVHELTAEQHLELLDFLRSLRGGVILSGYPAALYDKALQGWSRVERRALADGAAERTEVLWINPVAARARKPDLFAVSA